MTLKTLIFVFFVRIISNYAQNYDEHHHMDDSHCNWYNCTTKEYAVKIDTKLYNIDDIAHKYDCVTQKIENTGYFLLIPKTGHQTRDFLEKLREDQRFFSVEPQYRKKRKRRGLFQTITSNRITRGGQSWHMNRMGIKEAHESDLTGRNVVISILDDGVEKNHTDLRFNFDAVNSIDIIDNDTDPTPPADPYESHGTRNAGLTSGAEHGVCGKGIAYKSNLTGIRMLDANITDSVEGVSLGYHQDKIDIYSCSWGPNDDGKTVDGPGVITKEAFERGVREGRHGKGNIFVWAAGDGGKYDDSCACDGYMASIETVGVSSISENNNRPYYAESCPAIMTVTYSSGDEETERSILTTDIQGHCTNEHSGTSASAPIAAGILALALQENPTLTWRDVQHLIVVTSDPKPLLIQDGWITNGVNRTVHDFFGYGVINAKRLADSAKTWKTVPPQFNCTLTYNMKKPKIITGYGFEKKFTIHVDKCADFENFFVEHVQAEISINMTRRGELEIELWSPMGTKSLLLHKRIFDTDENNVGFVKWPFLSVQLWGERAIGKWTVVFRTASNYNKATFKAWTLKIFGTKENIHIK